MRPFAVALIFSVLSVACMAQEGNAPDTSKRFRELQARFDQIEAALPADQRAGASRLAEAKLALRKLRVRLSGTSRWYVTSSAELLFTQAEQALAGLGKGMPVEPRTGFQERAYLSEIDGSPEPFFLYVPTAYRPDRAWPLLLFLHGYSPDLEADTWHDLMYPSVLQETCQREGVILLVPYGRSNTEFMGIGEQDVLRTLACVRAEYRVDPQRIILSGVSMGGSGAYSIACHQPDLFAGLIGMTGRVDYYTWMKVRKDSLPRFKQVQVDTDYARELLPNLLNLPVLLLHGADDWAIPPAQSRLMRDLLQALDQRVEYDEIANGSHTDLWRTPFMAHARLVEMLRAARRPERPESVRFRTYSLKYPQSFWVRIDEMQDSGAMGEVSATVTGEGALTVQTTNVAGLTLGPGLPERARPDLETVTVNGKKVRAARTADGALVIRLEQPVNVAGLTLGPGLPERARPDLETVTVNGKKVRAARTADGALVIRLEQPVKDGLRKSPRLCGPIREAYAGPFLIVYPGADTPETAADRGNARRLIQEWYEYAQGIPRVRPDTAVGDKEIAEYNLILCGSPKTNAVLARIADKLPLRIEPDKYVLGRREFPRAGNGAQCLYPNPLNPERYVLLVDGAPWGTQLQRNHKLDFLPDFIIYTGRTEPDGTLFPTNGALCAGYFDSRWQLSDTSTWTGP